MSWNRLAFLVLSAAAVFLMGYAGAREDHAPILVQTDAGLVLPDAALGNGVRGGTGLPNDPWRISGWRIVGDDLHPPIQIYDVRGSVLIEDVELTGGHGLIGFGIVLGGASEVVIRNVTFRGGYGILQARESQSVHLENPTIVDFNPEFIDWCIELRRSNLTLIGLKLGHPCGRVIIEPMGRSNVDATRIDLRDSSSFIENLDAGESLRLSNSWFEGRSEHVSGEIIPNFGSSGGAIHLSNVTLSRTGWGVFYDFEERPEFLERDPGPLWLEDVTFDGSFMGLQLSGLSPGQVKLRDSAFIGADEAIGTSVGFTAERVLFQENRAAVRVSAGSPEGTTLVFKDSTFHGNDVNVKRPEGRDRGYPPTIVLENTWWDNDCWFSRDSCGFEGNVVVREPAQRPLVPPRESATRDVGYQVFLVLLLVGSAAFLARRFRKS